MTDTRQKPKQLPRLTKRTQSRIILAKPDFGITVINRLRRPLLNALLVLLGLCPIGNNQNVNTVANALTQPGAVFRDDPEQLFVEAMKMAETGDWTDVGKRLDEACGLWIKRGDVERAARGRLQIGDLYRNDKRYDESLIQYSQILLIPELSPSLKALAHNLAGQIYAELYENELALHNYTKALTLARLNKDSAVQVQVQLNLAALSNRSGNFVQAMELAQSAVTASDHGNDE